MWWTARDLVGWGLSSCAGLIIVRLSLSKERRQTYSIRGRLVLFKYILVMGERNGTRMATLMGWFYG